VNEEQKMNTPKAKLPTKTKIAVWWLIVVGVALMIFLLILSPYSFYFSFNAGQLQQAIIIAVILFIGSILYFASGFFLLKRSKRVWIVVVTLLSIIALCPIGIYLYESIDFAKYSEDATNYSEIPIILLPWALIYLTPLILTILDRKNYFKMVRQRELEKAQSVE
jgi:cation transport ATPase